MIYSGLCPSWVLGCPAKVIATCSRARRCGHGTGEQTAVRGRGGGREEEIINSGQFLDKRGQQWGMNLDGKYFSDHLGCYFSRQFYQISPIYPHEPTL